MQIQNTKDGINNEKEKWVLGWDLRMEEFDSRYGRISKIRCSYIESYYSTTTMNDDGEIFYIIYMTTVSNKEYRTEELDQIKYYEFCDIIEGV